MQVNYLKAGLKITFVTLIFAIGVATANRTLKIILVNFYKKLDATKFLN